MKEIKKINNANFKIKDFYSIIKIFESLDKETQISIFKISSFTLYKKIKKELEKRNTNFRLKDYNNLFFTNILILKDFINKFYIINNKNSYNNKFINDFYFKIPNFNKLSDIEKFNIIFDTIILNNPKINHKKYKNFFLKERNKNKNKIFKIDILNKNYIKEINKQKKFSIKTNFYIKRKKNKLIKIYVFDINSNEFKLLFKTLSYIFNKSKFKVYITKDISSLITQNNKYINIFLVHDSLGLIEKSWITNNRYILSISNFYDDLFYLLNNDNSINLSNCKEFSISENKSIYNKRYYVANRVKKFIDLIREEVNEST